MSNFLKAKKNKKMEIKTNVIYKIYTKKIFHTGLMDNSYILYTIILEEKKKQNFVVKCNCRVEYGLNDISVSLSSSELICAEKKCM